MKQPTEQPKPEKPAKKPFFTENLTKDEIKKIQKKYENSPFPNQFTESEKYITKKKPE